MEKRFVNPRGKRKIKLLTFLNRKETYRRQFAHPQDSTLFQFSSVRLMICHEWCWWCLLTTTNTAFCKQTNNQSSNHWINQPTNHSINQWTNHSINQPIPPSITRSLNQAYIYWMTAIRCDAKDRMVWCTYLESLQEDAWVTIWQIICIILANSGEARLPLTLPICRKWLHLNRENKTYRIKRWELDERRKNLALARNTSTKDKHFIF